MQERKVEQGFNMSQSVRITALSRLISLKSSLSSFSDYDDDHYADGLHKRE
jgi:hypothetical protein